MSGKISVRAERSMRETFHVLAGTELRGNAVRFARRETGMARRILNNFTNGNFRISSQLAPALHYNVAIRPEIKPVNPDILLAESNGVDSEAGTRVLQSSAPQTNGGNGPKKNGKLLQLKEAIKDWYHNSSRRKLGILGAVGVLTSALGPTNVLMVLRPTILVAIANSPLGLLGAAVVSFAVNTLIVTLLHEGGKNLWNMHRSKQSRAAEPQQPPAEAKSPAEVMEALISHRFHGCNFVELLTAYETLRNLRAVLEKANEEDLSAEERADAEKKIELLINDIRSVSGQLDRNTLTPKQQENLRSAEAGKIIGENYNETEGDFKKTKANLEVLQKIREMTNPQKLSILAKELILKRGNAMVKKQVATNPHCPAMEVAEIINNIIPQRHKVIIEETIETRRMTLDEYAERGGDPASSGIDLGYDGSYTTEVVHYEYGAKDIQEACSIINAHPQTKHQEIVDLLSRINPELSSLLQHPCG